MNKHLKLFANHTAYEAAKNNIDKPNVVLCAQEDEVHFNPTPQPILVKTVYNTNFNTCVFGVLENKILKVSGTSIDYMFEVGPSGEVISSKKNAQNWIEQNFIPRLQNQGYEVISGTVVDFGNHEEEMIRNWNEYVEV